MSMRTDRVSALLKRDLSEIIQKDYQPNGTFVTVSNVRMTPDLSIAKVYISVFAPGRDEQVVYQFIDDQQVEIRMKLAGRIKNQVRKIPELQFFVDDTAEYVQQIEKAFRKIKKMPGSDKAKDPSE